VYLPHLLTPEGDLTSPKGSSADEKTDHISENFCKAQPQALTEVPYDIFTHACKRCRPTFWLVSNVGQAQKVIPLDWQIPLKDGPYLTPIEIHREGRGSSFNKLALSELILAFY
jgi:hypothetical protein